MVLSANVSPKQVTWTLWTAGGNQAVAGLRGVPHDQQATSRAFIVLHSVDVQWVVQDGTMCLP